MSRSYPPDVVVLDSEALIHVRVGSSKGKPHLLQTKSYRMAAETFSSAIVTPELTSEHALADVLRRLKLESGRWDKVSLLLPDSWFRMNILELPSLPARPSEAMQIVRWSLKRTLPIAPEDLRVNFEVVERTATGVKILVVSALEKTLASIERIFAAAGLEVVLIEPLGLNIWNAIAVREAATTKDRLFVYARERDFTTAVFRGSQPLFLRSRNLSGERTIEQEIRLSARYLRDTLASVAFETCYVVTNGSSRELESAIAEEFPAPVKSVGLRDIVTEVPSGISSYEAEVTACTGVFTG